MNAKQIIAAGTIVLLALCLVPAVDADTYITSAPSETLEFDNMNGGDITFSVYSDSPFTMDIRVVNESGGATIYTLSLIHI